MVPSSYDTTHFPLPVGSLLGNFLWRGNVAAIVTRFRASEHISGALGDGDSDVRGFVGYSFKRVRLTKKTPCALIHRVSAQPILDAGNHDPLGERVPGPGRVVSRKLHGESSPGSRLDREGIG